MVNTTLVGMTEVRSTHMFRTGEWPAHTGVWPAYYVITLQITADDTDVPTSASTRQLKV